MFVKTLIGRNAGAIVDMRVDAAQAGLSMGSCVLPTDEEMAAAGLPVTNGEAGRPEEMPEGYAAKPNEEDGGFDVFGPDGARLNDAPLRNLAQARDLARQHADANAGDAGGNGGGGQDDGPEEIPEGYADLAWGDLRALAARVAPDLKTPSKADCLAAIAAEVEKRAAAASAPAA